MKTLILGGTTFLGRHLVRHLVERGHETAIFTRGRARTEETDGLVRYVGDRDGDLAAIPRDGWDAVIDTSGYVPGVVAASCAHLASAGRYVFVSSISVYDPHGDTVGDGISPYVPRDPDFPDDDAHNYGPSKRRCEDVVRAVFDGRALVVRPGLIVGPYDPTNRFTYWVDRFAEDGDVAVPGPPERFVQFIDARDVATFVVRALKEERSGTYDLTGFPQAVTMADVVRECSVAPDRAAATIWIDDAFLESRGFTGWMDLPLWIGSSRGIPGFMNMLVDRAHEHGLTIRPLAETIHDTRLWSQTLAPTIPSAKVAGITRDRERELLAAWRERASGIV